MRASAFFLNVSAIATLFFCTCASGQTLYVPSGTSGIGTSLNGYVGVNVASPVDVFQVNSGRPILMGSNGGNGVYGSHIGFNMQINTGTSPNTVTKLGGTSQWGGAIVTVDYVGNYSLQTYNAGTDSASTINYAPQFTFTSGGNFGVGTANPGRRLDVNGVTRMRDSLYYGSSDEVGVISWGSMAGGVGFGMIARSGRSLSFGANDQWDHVVVSTAGYVGIGTTNPTQKLSVNGTIRAKEVIVEASPWPDDVFGAGYKLKTLSEVAAHIEAEGHLPDVPNAATVAEQGVAVGEMQKTLLRKVEELTLYVIAQDKHNREQDSHIAELLRENARLRGVVTALTTKADQSHESNP